VWYLTHPAPALPDNMGRLMKARFGLGHLTRHAVALRTVPVSG
jgi:hypothetical protein